MLGNLIGDFVKGKQFNGIPKSLHEGIVLHRKIDYFIDHHAAVLQLQKNIQSDLPKVSGIAIDLIFDHLLAKNWKKFHQQLRNDFLSNFYNFTRNYNELLPFEIKQFLKNMLTHKFINQYDEIYFLERSGAHLSNKISFPNALEKTATVFNQKQNLFKEVFYQFMQDAIIEFGEREQ